MRHVPESEVRIWRVTGDFHPGGAREAVKAMLRSPGALLLAALCVVAGTWVLETTILVTSDDLTFTVGLVLGAAWLAWACWRLVHWMEAVTVEFPVEAADAQAGGLRAERGPTSQIAPAGGHGHRSRSAADIASSISSLSHGHDRPSVDASIGA